MNAKLTALGFALAIGDRKAETTLQASRLQRFADFIRSAPQADVAEFLRGPKGTKADQHPAVLLMVKGTDEVAPTDVKSATVRLSQSRTLFNAFRSGWQFFDNEGKVLSGWNKATADATAYKKGQRDKQHASEQERARAELVGKMMLAAGKGADADKILAQADAQMERDAANEEQAAKFRKASAAAADAGQILFPKTANATTLANMIIGAYTAKGADKIAEAIMQALLEADKAKDKAKGKAEPAPEAKPAATQGAQATHTGEIAKAA